MRSRRGDTLQPTGDYAPAFRLSIRVSAAKRSASFGQGVYEVELDVAAFYREQGQALPPVPFLEVLVYRFGLDDPGQHYHLPFKLTAWGVSCFRGGA